jgi:hypothetical protein
MVRVAMGDLHRPNRKHGGNANALDGTNHSSAVPTLTATPPGIPPAIVLTTACVAVSITDTMLLEACERWFVEKRAIKAACAISIFKNTDLLDSLLIRLFDRVQ